jgi:AcrR family transcriptional regulator
MMNSSRPRGRGRPAGPSTTRDDILRVARRRFLAEGYQRVTLRSIAAEAGVDVALLSHYFGSKSGLFGATMQLAANPAARLDTAMQGGDITTVPVRVLRMLITTWDDPVIGAGLRAMAEVATREPEVNRGLREMVEREIVARFAERIGGADATARAAVAASHAMGIIFGRYVLRVEPLASMPADELVARAAPSLQVAMTGGRGRPVPGRRAGSGY